MAWSLDTYYLKKIIVSLLKYATLRNTNRLKQNVSKQSITQPARRRRHRPPTERESSLPGTSYVKDPDVTARQTPQVTS